MTRSKRRLAAAVSLLMLLSCFSAATTVTASAATKAPKKIYFKINASVTVPIETVDIGGTVKAKVSKVKPSNASKKVKWKSTKPSVATVNSKGEIKGKKKGTTYIVATSAKNKKVKAKKKVYVCDLNPKSVALDCKEWTMVVGDQKNIKAVVKHIKYGLNPKDKVVSWTSSNTKVATVNKGGVVTAVSAGSATISAKAGNKAAVCKLTVTAKPIKPTGISFEKENIILLEKETAVNPLVVEPNGAKADVVYSSSDAAVAAVDAAGKVTAAAPGTATITAKVKNNNSLTAAFEVTVKKDTSVYADKDNANQYRIKPNLLNYKAEGDDPYIATVGAWRESNKVTDQKVTYFENGEALSDNDIIISNGKMGMVLAVGTRNPWGYPSGSVLDAGYIKDGTPARDTIWSQEALINGWDSWAPENCGTVTFDLANYDFAECAESEDGLPAVKVTRNYTEIVVDGKKCDMSVTTYYSVPKGGDYAYMYDVVTNNGTKDVAGKTTRFAMTNKGDDGGSLKYLKDNRAVVSYGNKTGQEYAIAYTIPETQKDPKVNVNSNGGSLGYKELRGACSYPAGSTTTYQEYFMVSDKADTTQLTAFTNKINNKTTMNVSGTVVENNGSSAVADAVVVVKDGDDNLFGFYKANEKGEFSIDLPKGGYDLYIEKNGYGKGDELSVIKSKSGIRLKAGEKKASLTINLKDQNGAPVWGKVDVAGEYPNVRYTGNSVFQATEKGVIEAEVADLTNFEATVYGEGYFFYSDVVKINQDNVKDGAVDVTIEQKAAKPDGWLSGDLHHHANKNDGFADPKDAIPSHLAAALDVSYITDHDFTVNNNEAFELLSKDYAGEMAGFIPSEEISCSWAHFNVLPGTQESYDFFKDANKDNHVMNQFGQFKDFAKQTHDKEANITANHPWYSYGLFSSANQNSVPGGYTDDYDNIEINACSADSENADTLISATKLWTAFLDGGKYFGVDVAKPHYLIAGSDTHDVLVPGVTNKGTYARGESEHYNSGKARTFAKADSSGTITDVGLAFNKAVADGNSYISFGPILTLSEVPGGEAKTATGGAFDFTVDVDSLAAVKDVLLLTKDAETDYTVSALNGSMQDQKQLRYVNDQSKVGADENSEAAGHYEFSVPVKAGEKTWAAVLVMDENGNYAVTNPYWITGGAQ